MNIKGKLRLVLMVMVLKAVAGHAQEVEDFKNLELLAQSSRIDIAHAGIQGFMESVYKEPFENGVYIVNGDTPIYSDVELSEFFLQEVKSGWHSLKFGRNLIEPRLIIDAPQGQVAKWDDSIKKNLTYCISAAFGNRYQAVRDAMYQAAKAWMTESDVGLIHIDAFDAQCDENNDAVIFDVRPVDVDGKYLARAFFPRYPRIYRNVLIDSSSFNLDPSKKLQLVGILRHELGHVLGFRHEHTRPEAGACFEDRDWQPLTSYDAFSVMHYPQCKGLGDWSLSLTDKDKLGARCAYGPAPGSFHEETECQRSTVEFLELITYK